MIDYLTFEEVICKKKFNWTKDSHRLYLLSDQANYYAKSLQDFHADSEVYTRLLNEINRIQCEMMELLSD